MIPVIDARHVQRLSDPQFHLEFIQGLDVEDQMLFAAIGQDSELTMKAYELGGAIGFLHGFGFSLAEIRRLLELYVTMVERAMAPPAKDAP